MTPISGRINIRLTYPEAITAALVGVMRNLSCVYKGKKGRVPDDKLWQVHVEGAMGEAVVAKALRTYNPMTVDTFKDGGDVGERVQVRTRSQHHYDLIVRDNDRDDDVFVLVTGTCPDYQVHGWCYGKDAKKDRYLKDYGGHGEAWFVPQESLAPLPALPDEAIQLETT